MRVAFRFIAYSFLWSWSFWITAGIISYFGWGIPTAFLHYLGGIGPMAGAIITLLGWDSSSKRNFWLAVTDFNRIKLKWYLVIILLVPLLISFGILIDMVLGGIGYKPEMILEISGFPLKIFSFLIFYLIFGPIPEELGWRGILLPEFQRKLSPDLSAVLVGIIWAVWHLPLFFIKGSYQYQLEFGSPAFYMFNLMIILNSVIITWIYNNTKNSILAAILFHLAINFYGQMVAQTPRAETFTMISTLMLAGILIVSKKIRGNK